jgi:hypothetical protein
MVTGPDDGLLAPRRGVPPDCAWLLHDIILTDPEHDGHRALDT